MTLACVGGVRAKTRRSSINRGRVIEKIVQKASLIGHVIEDVVYEHVDPSRFQAELVGLGAAPEYKRDGFFVFSNLRAGTYTLHITGKRLQPVTLQVAVPANTHVLLDSLGDNELVVIVRDVANDNLSGTNKKITFDPVILTKQVRAGARIVSDSLPANSPARLLATLDAGEVTTARVENGVGLAINSIVRMVRDRSVRMNFDPYYMFDSSITRVVGRVVWQESPASPLVGAQVRVTHLNGAPVAPTDVHGVAIFTGQDVAGNSVVLGAEKDISVVTNETGDYNLYFSNETLAAYIITGATLLALEAAGVPESVRDVLAGGALKDKVFRGSDRFMAAVREALGKEGVSKEVVLRHQPLILQHSEGFIQDLTLEATLAGFNPASKTQPINTAQRKIVDFELSRA